MKRTSLFGQHQKLNAKFTEFSGWEMPVQYTSIIDEHNAVRTSVGVFDTSHMGTFLVSGANAEKFLDKVTLGNISGLSENKARYSMILNEDGGIKDDIIVYKTGGSYMIVVNAGNLEKDWQWLNSYKDTGVELKDISSDICLLAVQGPKAVEVMQTLSETNVQDMKYFTVTDLKLANISAEFCKIAKTGYTGEDGFEIFISNSAASALWEKLMASSVKSCGLGCRDTLRLEACLPLYGHELEEDINPIEAGFIKTVNFEKDFIGKQALLAVKDKPSRKSIAFECLSGIARNANVIYEGEKKVGFVTSGTFSPTLKKAIGMALVEAGADMNNLEVEIHGQRRKIKEVKKPFYKRAR